MRCPESEGRDRGDAECGLRSSSTEGQSAAKGGMWRNKTGRTVSELDEREVPWAKTGNVRRVLSAIKPR